LSPRPVVHCDTLADHPSSPLVPEEAMEAATLGWPTAAIEPLRRASRRSPLLLRAHAPRVDGNRRDRHLLQQHVGILLVEAEWPEGRRRPRDLASSPSRADDTSTNSCTALASAYTGTSASRSSISATRRGAEAEETAPLRALRSKLSLRHAVADGRRRLLHRAIFSG
jgi:hypothetical protein